ncbi:hypothetical protein BOTBODRAFT_40620 [Botryobasidium botryosum FD-172 SS1]|uniref:Uncharacterized protein n=1 Tax=Botryobasidium botryosum (strain FD-172 SS1) TaxID=930990 RepID=A0A067MXW5_BOTB1|nr:hypothetical protein BOTBODRAFT_40620 [Botryobasidium botryosum FD-172 SS1]
MAKSRASRSAPSSASKARLPPQTSESFSTPSKSKARATETLTNSPASSPRPAPYFYARSTKSVKMKVSPKLLFQDITNRNTPKLAPKTPASNPLSKLKLPLPATKSLIKGNKPKALNKHRDEGLSTEPAAVGRCTKGGKALKLRVAQSKEQQARSSNLELVQTPCSGRSKTPVRHGLRISGDTTLLSNMYATEQDQNLPQSLVGLGLTFPESAFSSSSTYRTFIENIPSGTSIQVHQETALDSTVTPEHSATPDILPSPSLSSIMSMPIDDLMTMHRSDSLILLVNEELPLEPSPTAFCSLHSLSEIAGSRDSLCLDIGLELLPPTSMVVDEEPPWSPTDDVEDEKDFGAIPQRLPKLARRSRKSQSIRGSPLLSTIIEVHEFDPWGMPLATSTSAIDENRHMISTTNDKLARRKAPSHLNVPDALPTSYSFSSEVSLDGMDFFTKHASRIDWPLPPRRTVTVLGGNHANGGGSALCTVENNNDIEYLHPTLPATQQRRHSIHFTPKKDSPPISSSQRRASTSHRGARVIPLTQTQVAQLSRNLDLTVDSDSTNNNDNSPNSLFSPDPSTPSLSPRINGVRVTFGSDQGALSATHFGLNTVTPTIIALSTTRPMSITCPSHDELSTFFRQHAESLVFYNDPSVVLSCAADLLIQFSKKKASRWTRSKEGQAGKKRPVKVKLEIFFEGRDVEGMAAEQQEHNFSTELVIKVPLPLTLGEIGRLLERHLNN